MRMRKVMVVVINLMLMRGNGVPMDNRVIMIFDLKSSRVVPVAYISKDVASRTRF